MSTKDFSSKQESMIADYLGWSVVSGSGARACHPGDIIGDDWLGECKTHEKSGKPIFFSSSVWTKICDESIFQHRNPVLFTDDGSQTIDKTWCMIHHFSIPESWSRFDFSKTFKTNFSMKHEDLIKLYPVDNIISGMRKPFCYIAGLSDSKVAVLPLRLFRELLEV